ncbi:FAD:protein FMN transferase [Enterococcus xiangfangensis]|uniref:FAD:protein FMN transferase n=1 Tax=Enterococcus xiangfangensis TaxID=1296537 RepID=UPI0010F9C2F7|nr:FAD:protein FMN transferase [Enterococcus xiangfangensis]MBM7712277.1 thiamine biosynthesis lipoprotein [Enterococcus xiangfangensis]NBK08755.1 FAD:protein FMN transferase [Enterococcus asini]
MSEKTVHLMGTTIKLWVDHPQAEKMLDDAEVRLRNFEQRFSANAADSELMAVNHQAGIAPVKVDEELFELIQIGKKQSLVSDSSLNIAIGPLIQEWRVGFADAKFPSPEKIQEKLTMIDPAAIQLDELNQTVFLSRPGMLLDLGALAKGYFADKIIADFKASGAKAAFIDLGGNVLTYGPAPQRADGRWRIGIQNPFLPRGNYVAVVKTQDESVVTSGIYERKFEWQGQSYHHIFDSKTGYPIQTDLASLTIVSKESLTGEIWTTRLFAKSAQEVLAELNQREIDGIIVTTDQRLAYSDGLKDRIDI